MSAGRLRSILVGTDLSAASDGPLRAAGGLAAAADAELHALHAFDLQPLPAHPQVAVPTFQARVAEAERALAEQLKRVLPRGVEPASRQIRIWAAHRALLERAEEVGADLVVVGPHTSQRAADAVLGTTADHVLRGSLAPVLVARTEVELPLRRVVVATDLSEESDRALEAGLRWAELLGPGAGDGTEVRALLVVPQLLGADPGSLDQLSTDRTLRDALEERLTASGVPAGVRGRADVVWGQAPAAEIVRYARMERPELLVIGTRGRGPLARAVLGSVASRVARRAPCPVLLVPPDGVAESRSPAGANPAGSETDRAGGPAPEP